MEPERHIEKLLRAYAKKRRAQAGDPLELHPATRHLLQGEIARNAPPPDGEDVSLTLWEVIRQQWAFLLGFALVVFFVATLFLPALNAAKHKAQKETAMARYHLMEIGTAARMFAKNNNERLPGSLDELTNELQLDLVNTIFIDPQNGQRFVYVGGGKHLDNLPSNSILAYSPTDKKGRAVLFADGHVEVINGARFSELTNREVQELAFAKDSARQQLIKTREEIPAASGIAAATPPFSGQLEAEDNRKEWKLGDLAIVATNAVELAANASAASHGFLRADASGLQNAFKNTLAPAKAVPVLVNFQVQQNGSAIRVVDADGSVYDGSLLPESAVAQNEPAPAATPAPPATVPAQVERAKTIASRNESQMAQNYFFRVSGTNRTLQQNVVFAGNLLAIASSTTNLPQSPGVNGSLGAGGGGGGQLQSALTNQNQLPWSNSRIAGTAVIAGTNHIEINAVPLSP
jgi:prepilin-type processing-associated H-X9-DG protein